MTKLTTAALATAIALGACGSPAQRPGTGLVPPSASAQNHGRSWMKPGISGDNLLYVATVTGDSGPGKTYVLSYPSGSLVGTLTGFQNPQGICSDKSGNVFITDADAATIVEYAHGGTTPIQTLSDSGEPSGCWVDPSSGDLAVSNYSSFVSIYKNAKGSPTNYPTDGTASFVTYDKSGDIFADGGRPVKVWELPKNGPSFETITLKKFPGSNHGPAGLQWIGNHIVIAHANPPFYLCCGRIYRYIISGTYGDNAGSMQPRGGSLHDFYIDGRTLIVTTGSVFVRIYDYPKGHRPIAMLRLPQSGTYGVTLSVAPSQK